MAAATAAWSDNLDIGCRQSEQAIDILPISRRQPAPDDLHGTEFRHRAFVKALRKQKKH